MRASVIHEEKALVSNAISSLAFMCTSTALTSAVGREERRIKLEGLSSGFIHNGLGDRQGL